MPPRLLLSCVSEDRPVFHARVENLVGSARRLGSSLADCPIVVNMVESADREFVQRMAAMDARVRIVPRITRGGVAQANKVHMLEIDTREQFDVLLAVDCDIVVAEDPIFHLSDRAISVVPADMDPLTDDQWRGLFSAVGVRQPERSELASMTGQPIYPYFNSGVIGVPRRLCSDLLAAWMQAMADLDALWRRQPRLISRKARFFTDQLALSVALWRGLPWIAASRELNFPTHVALHRPTVAGLRPALLHYHSEVDDDGFLFRPRCSTAEMAAERVNHSRAEALNLTYAGLRTPPDRKAQPARALVARIGNLARRVTEPVAPTGQ
jgi:hypothetical protein